MGGVEVVALLLFAILAILALIVNEQRLQDPSNHSVIYPELMKEIAILPERPVSVHLVRQSGNLYRELGVYMTPSEAFHEIEKSFRRAKIDSVGVMVNSASEFRVERLHYSHRGKAEGKKLGGAVVLLKELERTAP